MSAQTNNTIQVWNNGFGVPVDIHKEENVYIPELIFGHLLTSSNYDDNEKKVGVLQPPPLPAHRLPFKPAASSGHLSPA